MNRRPCRPPPALVVLVAAELVSAVLAWHDLAHRNDDEVRGGRTGWRLLIVLNPGNLLAYWAFGRRCRSNTA